MKAVVNNVAAWLALLLIAGSLAAQQSAGRDTAQVEYPPVYRIEVIVFRHADGRSDRIRSGTPVDFTESLDPLLVARANDIAERHLARLAKGLPVARIPGEVDENTPRLEADELVLRPIPPMYSALGALSRQTQRALDRLTDAPEYEPLATRAWMQLAQRNGATAAVRVHDRSLVDLIEPEDNRSLVPMPQVMPFGPLVETPPPALDIYRLDGTLKLRRRQFLHLDLDLVWQTRSRALSDRAMPSEEPGGATGEGEWLLHRLQQSRIVEPGRIEYFDSSLFGVLVRIDRFAQIVPEIESPEPAPSAEIVDPVTNSGL